MWVILIQKTGLFVPEKALTAVIAKATKCFMKRPNREHEIRQKKDRLCADAPSKCSTQEVKCFTQRGLKGAPLEKTEGLAVLSRKIRKFAEQFSIFCL